MVKKISTLLVLLMLLVVVGAVGTVAAMPAPVSDTEASPNIDFCAGTRKWIDNYLVKIGNGKTAPTTIMYDQGGYRGILTRFHLLPFTDGTAYAWYQGWVYSGGVSPFNELDSK